MQLVGHLDLLIGYHFDQPCFYKEHFGFECPGCGIQRAVRFLLNGQLVDSIKAFPALLPLIIMVGFLLLHLIFKFRHGPEIIKYLFIFNVILIAGNYLLKLIF